MMMPEAKVQSLRLHRMKQSISAATCITLGSLTDKDSSGRELHSTAWMITDKNYSLAMLTKLQVVPLSQCRESWATAAHVCNPPETKVDFLVFPSKPLCAIPSTEWFATTVRDELTTDNKRAVVPKTKCGVTERERPGMNY